MSHDNNLLSRRNLSSNLADATSSAKDGDLETAALGRRQGSTVHGMALHK
jgi:hypothetical protein